MPVRFFELILVRRLLCIFLLMLLPLHSFAMQTGWLSAVNAFDIAHEIEHLKAASHHHHDNDGSVHYDDSGESEAHFADHSASQQSASLPPGAMPSLPAESCMIKRFELTYSIPDPFLENPQRPPASLG
jgi:hypothetical protein